MTLSSNPLFPELNKKVHKLCVDNGICEDILWYIDRVGYYGGLLESGEEEFDCGGVMGVMDRGQVLFQWTFWLEAMVWYIRSLKDKE